MRLTSVILTACLSAAAMGQTPATALSRRIAYWNPVWSPDGRLILFESTLPGKSGIYVINRDGSNLRRMTADSSENYQPNWSPDGQRIVFSSDRAGHGDLYLMHADGSGLTRLTRMPSGAYYQASFSPDGKRIVFQGRPDNSLTSDRVFVIGVDGTGLRQLTDSAYGAEGPRWAPDGSIHFLQVPYPQRFWRDMQDDDMKKARSGQRLMRVQVDGSGLTPVAKGPGRSDVSWSADGSRGFFTSSADDVEAVFELRRGDTTGRRVVSTAVVPADFEPSPDGSFLVYTKSSGGYAGLYVYDVRSRTEQLLTGGAAAGPLGYLRTAALAAATDTFDTFSSLKTGGDRADGGTSYVRVLRRAGAQRWELTDSWSDSSGRVTARQSVRTIDGSLATEIETVRADVDSASLLVAPSRVTAWVVPQGGPVRLFDGPPAGERYATTLVVAAIARSRPAIGASYEAPVAGLYSANPLLPVIDTLRVVARDTVLRAGSPLAVLVIERNSGTRYWVDEQTGVQVADRGNAGPQRWWWHIRRGVELRNR